MQLPCAQEPPAAPLPVPVENVPVPRRRHGGAYGDDPVADKEGDALPVVMAYEDEQAAAAGPSQPCTKARGKQPEGTFGDATDESCQLSFELH